jgi:hypothetical protein
MIAFPPYTGLRCLMMPYVQGDPDSVPAVYAPYRDILASTYVRRGDRGFLTIAEIGILTPHESLPVPADVRRQFLRIVGSGVHGRELYFTENLLYG